MFTALRNNDKVGLLFFTDDVVKYIPPRKGRANVLRLIRELLATEPVKAQTDISKALDFLGRVQRRRCVVFVMSDFLGPDCSRALAIANQRHDCVAVTMSDPRESSLPDVGFLTLRDAETDELLELDTRHPRVRALFAKTAQRSGATSLGLASPSQRRPPRDSHRPALRDQSAKVFSDAGTATMIDNAGSKIRCRSARLFHFRWGKVGAMICVLIALSLPSGCGGMRTKDGAASSPSADAIERTAEEGPVKLVGASLAQQTSVVGSRGNGRSRRVPEGVEIKPPAFGQAVGDFLIRDYSERPPEAGAREPRRFHYQLEPAQGGKHLIRSVSIEFVDRRPNSERPGEATLVETDPLELEVTSELSDQAPAWRTLSPCRRRSRCRGISDSAGWLRRAWEFCSRSSRGGTAST